MTSGPSASVQIDVFAIEMRLDIGYFDAQANWGNVVVQPSPFKARRLTQPQRTKWKSVMADKPCTWRV